MFGLPENNSHGYDIGTIGDIVKDVHYGTAKKASEDGKYIYIRMNNITYDGELDLTDIKRIDVPEKELAGCLVQEGDVLFNRTNSKELVGKTCHFTGKEPMIIAGYIIRLRMNGKVLPEYISTFMNLGRSKQLLYSMAKGAVGQANINATEVQSIPIVIPPEPVQQEFLKLRRQSDKSKFIGFKSQFIEMFGRPGYDDKGWGLTTLGECCELNPRRAQGIDDDLAVSFLAMPSVSEDGHMDTKVIRIYSEVKKGFTYFAEKDVLFAKITPCMENGKGAVAEGLSNGIGAGSTEFHVLRPIPQKSNPYWLYIITMFDAFRINARKVMTGTGGQLRVPISYLKDYPITLPPIELQNEFEMFYRQSDKSK